MLRLVRTLGCVSLFALITANLWGQGMFATLTGVVTDPSQSVVPSAKVTLRDLGSGSARETVSNSEGYYSFASVPVGTYSLTVEAQGFKTHKEDTIRLGGGEQRNVNVALAVGGSTETVEVTGMQDFTVVPVDNGEKSYTLSTKELENFTQVGSNAAEYIKIVPGFGINNGNSNKSNYNGQTIGINANGDSGSQSPLNNAYSYNGLPPNTLDIVSDGAHVSDPGCNCDTPVNPNSDFLQEFKVFTSNFNAEDQKGPALITSVTKAGGTTYHGNAFFYARNYVLNANDAYSKALKQTQPANKYYYPGGSIGGPVPKTKKLFFFTGLEYFHQVLDTGLLRATVPCSSMLGGTSGNTFDFSNSSIQTCEGAKTASGNAPGLLNAAATTAFGGTTISPCSGAPNGNCVDANMLALAKLYPAANADPNATNGFNYVQSEIFNQNNRQWVTRVDYNVSDNTKVFVRYNYQRETQLFPIGLWWRNGSQVPYPSSVEGKNRSDALSGSITHVFSPTMTNEVVLAYGFVGFPNVFSNPDKVDRTKVGFGYAGLTMAGTKPITQIPSFGQFGGEAALVFNPSGFEAGGKSSGLYANKYMPSVSDTVTKVWRTHTIKAGFFWEKIRNAQPASESANGAMYFDTSNPDTWGNPYADLLTGNMNSYGQTNYDRINDISYNTVEFFGQDSWKINRKLTAEFGLRFTHFTPWTDRKGFGYSIFDLSKFSPSCASAFCGFEWHAADSSVPLTGFPTKGLYLQPRFGFAYDVFGTGKTVLRGGWGRFYFHSGQFTNGLDASAGVTTANLSPTNWTANGGAGTCAQTSGPLFAFNLSCIKAAAAPSSPFAVDSKDNKQPYNDSYSFTIAQKTPWQGLLEASYVGNTSNNLLNTGGAGSNINLVPLGAMFAAAQPGLANANCYRVLNDPNTCAGYGDLNVATNNLYANYNSMQLTWGRHAGRYVLQFNYVYEKALGIVSSGNPASGSNVVYNQLNIHANYGVQPGNRTQLFNAAYSIELGNPIHDNKLLGGVANGWQLSGITQIQSGANITYNSGGANFGFTLKNAAGNGPATDATGDVLNNQWFLGTNAIQLNPVITCNPRSGLATHQYVNPNCFAVPGARGQNGAALLPVVYGPGFFNSDLALFKNFKVTESQNLQFRIQAYNFLNHPLWSFPGNENLGLTFDQAAAGSSSFVLDPNSAASFGRTVHKEGRRVLELALKYSF